MEKQRKQECQQVIEINQLEHVMKKKTQLTANLVKKAQLTVNEVNQLEHVAKKRAPLTLNELKHFEEQ